MLVLRCIPRYGVIVLDGSHNAADTTHAERDRALVPDTRHMMADESRCPFRPLTPVSMGVISAATRIKFPHVGKLEQTWWQSNTQNIIVNTVQQHYRRWGIEQWFFVWTLLKGQKMLIISGVLPRWTAMGPSLLMYVWGWQKQNWSALLSLSHAPDAET